MLRVLEYAWRKHHRIPTPHSVNFKGSERRRAESEGGGCGWRGQIWRKKHRGERWEAQMHRRERHRGFNFNPRVTEFTDICTRIRLAIPRSFSETTLSLLSVPETYSSSYIRCRMSPFTVLRVEEEKKKETQKSKLNWMCWIWARLAWQFATLYVLKIPLLYCMHSYRGINKEGGGGWHVTSDSFELSTCHLRHIQTSCHLFTLPLWWRWPRS